ncbi:sialidase family protein [Salinibacterium soli]|uniref:Sialidase family protein n=1 Tax=Antiquaquibacter soli TaxID=3064523 RepID=A0ABT9BNI0_9MICO|nr:sialidase family protein [Protaetiibacter sp. WY-16]MDO7882573.1 sialidase family protein [Protaetiibacter sp. WY-16]
MTHARTFRRSIPALLGTATLAALLSLGASPALAADAPWTTPVEVTDAYGDASATVVAPDGTITVLTETVDGIVSATSIDGGIYWAGAVSVGSGGDYAFRPSLGITSSGLLAAAWVESASGDRTIHVAVSSNGGSSWGIPQTLPTIDSYVDDPVVGSAGATGFTVVWNEGFTKLSSTSTDSGSTWGSAQVITQNLNSYNRASIASPASGELAVLFQEFDGDTARYSIQSKVSTDGGATWGPKVPVGEDWSGGLGNGIYSYVVSPSAGTLVAVWGRGTVDGEGLFAATSTDGGASWSTQFPVGSSAGQLRYFRTIVVSPTTAGVLWHDGTMDGATLYYATVSVGASAASTPVDITTSPSYGLENVPAIASLGDALVAAWLEYDADDIPSYFASVSCDAGATWSAPATLASGDTLAENEPQVTGVGATFTAIWGQDGSGPSDQSLVASSLTGACGLVPPAPGPALAATGSTVATGGVVLAGVILALGVGVVAARRRAEA